MLMSTGQARLILARHGQTTANAAGLLDTRPPGAELTERGRSQARDLGETLASVCGSQLGAIYSGVALRAQQTSVAAHSRYQELTHRALAPIEIRLGIHEISAGEYEHSARPEDHERYFAHFARWLCGENAPLPGGEGLEAILARVRPVLDEAVQTHVNAQRDAVIVCHGALSRVTALHACGLDPRFVGENRLHNCAVIVMEPRGRDYGQWTLTHWNSQPI